MIALWFTLDARPGQRQRPSGSLENDTAPWYSSFLITGLLLSHLGCHTSFTVTSLLVIPFALPFSVTFFKSPRGLGSSGCLSHWRVQLSRCLPAHHLADGCKASFTSAAPKAEEQHQAGVSCRVPFLPLHLSPSCLTCYLFHKEAPGRNMLLFFPKCHTIAKGNFLRNGLWGPRPGGGKRREPGFSLQPAPAPRSPLPA